MNLTLDKSLVLHFLPLLVPVLFLTVAVILIVTNILVVPESQRFVVERFGKFHRVWMPGIHVKMPFIDHVRVRVTTKEQTVDTPPHKVITKDNVQVEMDALVFFSVIDAERFCYGHVSPVYAIENLATTLMRDIAGTMDLDELLSSRDKVNAIVKSELFATVGNWGICANRVEIKAISPPESILLAMEKQLRAERERKEKILLSEGEKVAMVTRAQGERDAAELEAEAKKVRITREAEAQAEALRLNKEAEAEGIRWVREAEAEGIRCLLEAGLSTEQVVAMRRIQGFEKAADGQATKILVPNELAGITGLAFSVKESASEESVQKDGP